MPYTFEKSKALFARAKGSIAGGINSGIRKMEEPVPLYFTHGKGARLHDVDGNEYLDFQILWRTVLIDLEGIREFYTILHTLQAKQVAILTASHLLTEIESRLDHLYLLKDGRFQQSGTIKALIEAAS